MIAIYHTTPSNSRSTRYEIRESLRGSILPTRGNGAYRTVVTFAEVAARYLAATGRANIPPSLCMDLDDFKQLAESVAECAQEPLDCPETPNAIEAKACSHLTHKKSPIASSARQYAVGAKGLRRESYLCL